MLVLDPEVLKLDAAGFSSSQAMQLEMIPVSLTTCHAIAIKTAHADQKASRYIIVHYCVHICSRMHIESEASMRIVENEHIIYQHVTSVLPLLPACRRLPEGWAAAPLPPAPQQQTPGP